jgi:sucrose-6-phosphate hydrolase SacC (GH32 family)
VNYAPPGCYLWDTWFMPVADRVHCFHLVWPEFRPGGDPHGRDWRWIGHAASRDLVNWETLPPALGPDSANPLDNGQP